MMRVLDLFSGIGGFALGLERAGMRAVAFCEIDAFCRRVLARHWPEVPCYDDVRSLTADRLRADGIAVDLICGGFPCQDISFAGRGAGIDGERSGLWSEFARLIGELRPRYVIVENVAALLVRGLDRVLGDLAALGFDAEWHCIPASAVGAPHRRDRVWIIAYRQGDALGTDADSIGPHCPTLHVDRGAELRHEQVGHAQSVGNAVPDPARERWRRIKPGWGSLRGNPDAPGDGTCGRVAGSDVADARRNGGAQEPRHVSGETGEAEIGARRRVQSEPRDGRPSGRSQLIRAVGGEWLPEPAVGRVVDGFPGRVDRLRALGNAVVPQIPELLGRAILAAEADRPIRQSPAFPIRPGCRT